jgi:hypothetical protein
MRMFEVSYKGKEPFVDMCGGVPFEIKYGEKKQIDEIAARHIFGLGEQDKERALVRLGWLRNLGREGPGGWDEAMAKLGAFVFNELHLTAKTDGTSNATNVQAASRAPTA